MGVVSIIWTILPCWHCKKLGLGKSLGLGKDGLREAMSTFENARFLGVISGWFGSRGALLWNSCELGAISLEVIS